MDPPYDVSPPRTAPGGAKRPGSRPNWWGPATSRAQTAQSWRAPSQVEVMFHHQYAAQAPPLPMDDVRALLASEPAPPWSSKASKSKAAPAQLRPVHHHGRPNRRPRPRPQGRTRSKEARVRREEPAETVAVEAVKPSEALRPLPPWLGVAEDHTEGGVQLDIALHVVERVRHLHAVNSNNFIWVIIESCRDCAHHDASLRHDEAAYKGRCQKIMETVIERFPEGVQVDVLGETPPPLPSEELNGSTEDLGEVEDPNGATKNVTPPGPSYRIGSFEVYVCCLAPLKPWGAAPLSKRGFGANVYGLCISSKLKSRAWPSIDVVLRRMAMSMPQVPVQVLVQNALGFPIPGVSLAVLNGDQQIHQSSTDQNGLAQLFVPLFAPTTLRAERTTPAVHMERQEKLLEIMAPGTQITFTAETCIQLWQLETEKELIVFCRDPRMDMELGVQPIPNLMPFAGNVEYSSGEALRADSNGFIRSMEDPLANADFFSCSGWRSSPVATSEQIHGTGRLVEVGRLEIPIAQISFVTCCCESALPNARVSVDGVHFGTTDLQGPVNCSVRMGDHELLVEHSFLSSPGLNLPLNIQGSTTCGIPVDFPLDRLRFLCTAAPGTRMPQHGEGLTSDLWLVGGDLAQWRCSRGAPAMDAEVWLWDGELRGEQTLKVQAGALDRHPWGQLEDRTDSSMTLDEGRSCPFTQALAHPMAKIGPWQVVLQCAPPKGNQECAVLRLAKLAGDAPALWLARLVPVTDDALEAETATVEPCLHVHSTCCSAGAAQGCSVTVNGEAVGQVGDHGELKLPTVSGSCLVGIQGVPACLLPGSTTEYLAHFDCSKRMDLDLACLVWVYAWHPEADDDEEEPAPAAMDALVFVCTNVDQIPDEAKPVVGRLCCAEAEEPEIMLEGQSVGPILLRRSRLFTPGVTCLVAQLALDVVAPPGYVYEARWPSPLQLRHQELGGCELQRLMYSPTVLGDLKPVNAQDRFDPGNLSSASDGEGG